MMSWNVHFTKIFQWNIYTELDFNSKCGKYEISSLIYRFFVATNWLDDMARTPEIWILFIFVSNQFYILNSDSKKQALSHSSIFIAAFEMALHNSMWNSRIPCTRVIAFDCGFLTFFVCLWCYLLAIIAAICDFTHVYLEKKSIM